MGLGVDSFPLKRTKKPTEVGLVVTLRFSFFEEFCSSDGQRRERSPQSFNIDTGNGVATTGTVAAAMLKLCVTLRTMAFATADCG